MLLQLSKTVKQSPKSPQIFENNGTFCADRPFSKNRSETNCQKSFVFNQLVSELQSYILSTTTETCLNDSFKSGVKLQSYILSTTTETCFKLAFHPCFKLQSYILSTTTETSQIFRDIEQSQGASIVHPFNNNWNSKIICQHRKPKSFNRTSFQQQLKLRVILFLSVVVFSFNRTSFQQQLKLEVMISSNQNFIRASIVHPFNNNWNSMRPSCDRARLSRFNRTSFQQQLKLLVDLVIARDALLQSYILSTTTETLRYSDCNRHRPASIVHPFNNNWNASDAWGISQTFPLQSYILSTTTETSRSAAPRFLRYWLQSYILSTTTETLMSPAIVLDIFASIVHPFNNNWNILLPLARYRER